MKQLTLFLFALFSFSFFTVTTAQIVKGPKNGSVASGVAVSTGSFKFSPSDDEFDKRESPNMPDVPLLPAPANMISPLGPEGSNYFEDRGIENFPAGISRPVVQKNFQGFGDQGGFPPDPIMAAGPNHIIVCVNSSFRIFDKNGTQLKSISAATWFSSIAPGSGPNDPQIIYDHFAGRWVMQWMTSPTTTEHFHMFSVSDDDNPIGTWYNWKTSSVHVGDSSIGSWGDYPALGFDSEALYLVSRQFTLSGSSYRYGKLRILNKQDLYANTGGQITWKDFWDFRDPQSTGVAPDNIRPATVFGNPSMAYMMNSSPFGSGTYFTLWKISNPLTSPTITASNIPVTAYSSAPNANQLGGSSTLIEGGSSRIRANIIYRDSSLWAVHSIASGSGNSFSSVRYVRINPSTNTVLEDVAMGKEGFWHIYPAIMVTQDTNIIITYSRSGETEYVGAYVTGRRKTDSPGLAPSVPVKAGLSNYVRVGGGRNRWGDYSGIGLDPEDGKSVWTLTEYAAQSANTYGTWVGKTQMSPFPGISLQLNQSSISFGPFQLGSGSDTLELIVTNDGDDTLEISNIASPSNHFHLVNVPSFPIHISYFDSLKIGVSFFPEATGTFNDSIVISSNNTSAPTISVPVNGRGFEITPAQRGVLYAGSGISDGGRLLTVEPTTGAITSVGASGYPEIVSARVHPQTHEIIGLAKSGGVYNLVRMNASGGDAYSLTPITISNPKGMEFTPSGALYIGSFGGTIYSVDMNTGDALEVAVTNIPIAGLAFNPLTGKLWASVRPTLSGKDRIFKINLPSGDTDLVGTTGLSATVSDIIFDGNGRLWGINGSGTAVNSLLRIDTTNGAGTIVGSMGISSVLSLAMWQDSFQVGVQDFEASVPQRYSLEQNYPNPFNPSTAISFQLPAISNVSLKIYNVLGQEIATLVNKELKAGRYSVAWDASNVPSGMYFYRLHAGNFSATKKLLLMK